MMYVRWVRTRGFVSRYRVAIRESWRLQKFHDQARKDATLVVYLDSMSSSSGVDIRRGFFVPRGDSASMSHVKIARGGAAQEPQWQTFLDAGGAA